MKVHTFVIWEIQTSRGIQHVSLLLKQSVAQRGSFPEIMGSLGSHQLLQLQLFSQIFKILDPPF